MKTQKFKISLVALLFATLTTVLSSCKKAEEIEPTPEPQPAPIDTTIDNGNNTNGGGTTTITPTPVLNLGYDYIKWVYEGQTDTVVQKYFEWNLENGQGSTTTQYTGDINLAKKVLFQTSDGDATFITFSTMTFPSVFETVTLENASNGNKIYFFDDYTTNGLIIDVTKSSLTFEGTYKDANNYRKVHGGFRIYETSTGKYIVGKFDTHL